jgi:hypothetical protein
VDSADLPRDGQVVGGIGLLMRLSDIEQDCFDVDGMERWHIVLIDPAGKLVDNTSYRQLFKSHTSISHFQR